MIDHKRKLLFVHIARTGGTSVESVLVGKDWWFIEPSTKHISANQARQYYGEEIWKNYKKFSIVRNPWDRVISMWATKKWHRVLNLSEDCSLETFIENLRPHPRETYNSLYYHEILNDDIDFILRFERLQEDFDNLLDRLGFDKVQLPYINKKQRKRYTDMYQEKEKELVRKMFDTDITHYSYMF